MAFNLPETVNSLFTNNVITRAASSLNESEGGIQKAISGIIPSVLTGLLTKAGSTSNAASSVYGMARDAAGSGVLNNVSGLLGSAGTSMSNLFNMSGNVFGDKLNNIINMIASFAGIKQSSASTLLNMATPAALGVVGKYASDNDLNSNGVVNMLSSQKDKILSWVPSGLGLANALGLGSLSDIGTRITGAMSAVGDATRKRTNWLPLVLLILIGALLWFFLKGRGDKEPDVEPAATGVTTPVETERDRPATVAPTSIKVMLPDGRELDAYRGGIEDRLVIFLNDASSKPGKDVWFDFDDLNFEMGSSRITAESQKQVNNIAAILKAYPKAKIKIGGYTDRTGDAAANKKLSLDRAEAVENALKAAGVNKAQLLGAEGYGSDFATVPAEGTEDERKKDRRIAVSVREK